MFHGCSNTHSCQFPLNFSENKAQKFSKQESFTGGGAPSRFFCISSKPPAHPFLFPRDQNIVMAPGRYPSQRLSVHQYTPKSGSAHPQYLSFSCPLLNLLKNAGLIPRSSLQKPKLISLALEIFSQLKSSELPA